MRTAHFACSLSVPMMARSFPQVAAYPATSFRTIAAAAGVDQSAEPSSRARSRPSLSMTTLVGMPRTCQVRPPPLWDPAAPAVR